MHKKIDLIEKESWSMWLLHAESVQKIYKSGIGQNFDLTTCRKIGPGTINSCNTKIFSGRFIHINFRKSQEISAKLNDSVKSYNKKTIESPPS